jgi:hypothetical protein
MRIPIGFNADPDPAFSSMRIPGQGAKPLRIHAVHNQLDRAREKNTKLFTTVVWIRISFNADPVQAF